MEFPAVWAVIAAGWTKKGRSSASDATFAQTQDKMRGIVQGFRAFSRCTKADACTLLSLYGLCAIEVDRLQNSRVQDERGAGDTARIESDRELSGKCDENTRISLSRDDVPYSKYKRRHSGAA